MSLKSLFLQTFMRDKKIATLIKCTESAIRDAEDEFNRLDSNEFLKAARELLQYIAACPHDKKAMNALTHSLDRLTGVGSDFNALFRENYIASYMGSLKAPEESQELYEACKYEFGERFAQKSYAILEKYKGGYMRPKSQTTFYANDIVGNCFPKDLTSLIIAHTDYRERVATTILPSNIYDGVIQFCQENPRNISEQAKLHLADAVANNCNSVHSRANAIVLIQDIKVEGHWFYANECRRDPERYEALYDVPAMMQRLSGAGSAAVLMHKVGY